MSTDFLIVGLGNPGPEYARTRHNLGAMALSACADAWSFPPFRKRFEGLFVQSSLDGREIALLFPQTYMNLSGRSVGAAMRSLAIARERILVLHDDVDLPFGRIRVKVGGGHGGHNGLKSIVACIGGPEFIRVRLGVGRPTGDDMVDHVLSPFFSEEKQALPRILEKSVEIVKTILNEGPTYAMNAFNGQS